MYVSQAELVETSHCLAISRNPDRLLNFAKLGQVEMLTTCSVAPSMSFVSTTELSRPNKFNKP